MINVVYADGYGGVFTVSTTLCSAFGKAGVECKAINLNDHGNRLHAKILNVLKILKGTPKSNFFILQHFDAIFLGLFLNLFGFKRLVNVVHTDLVSFYESCSFFKKLIIKALFFIVRSNLIVFVSKEAELKARIFFKLRNTRTIYNIFDFGSFPNSDKKLIHEEKVIFGTVSRLSKTKNVDLAILVVSELRKRNINVELYVFGDGDKEERLELYMLVEKLDVTDYIHFHGAVKDKSKIFNSIDAFVSFSSLEGFGMSIIESIYYGVPVFHTDCSSGPRELISPDSPILDKTKSYEKTNVGYLVKPVANNKVYESILSHHNKEYVNLLEFFLIDLRQGAFDMNYNFERFSEKNVVNQWRDLLDLPR